MKMTICCASLALTMLVASQSWAQSSTATGNYLGQKVPPVLATELDAAPGRITPPASGPATGPAGTGRERDRERDSGASVPTYTGVQNSESMGNAVPNTTLGTQQSGR